MLSERRLIYALVKDGVYEILGKVDASWITDPVCQKLVGAVAESLSINGSAKLPEVINIIDQSKHLPTHKDIYISNLKQIVSSQMVWVPELPEQLLSDYQDFHKDKLAKVLSDDMSTVEQRLNAVEEYRTALIGVSAKGGENLYDTAKAHIERIESGEMTLIKEKSYHLKNENLRMMFSNGVIPPVAICIGGREGYNKTMTLTNIVMDLASSRKGVFYNLEDSNETFSSKYMAAKSMIDYSKLMMGDMTSEEIKHYKLVNESGGLRNVTTVEKDFTVDEWERDCRKRILTEDIQWVAIDFIQSFRDIGRSISDIAVNLSRATKAARQLSREFFIPIIYLSQVNENGENDGEIELHIGNLKGSGSIKENCRIVFMLDGVREGNLRNWKCVKNSGFGSNFKRVIEFNMPVGRIKNVTFS